MSLLKPSKAKIGTTFLFIIFSFLNPAVNSIPKKFYKEEVEKYYTFKGETPELVESREKYMSEAFATLEIPSKSETARIMKLGYLNVTAQLIITFIMAYFFACIIYHVRPVENA